MIKNKIPLNYHASIFKFHIGKICFKYVVLTNRKYNFFDDVLKYTMVLSSKLNVCIYIRMYILH